MLKGYMELRQWTSRQMGPDSACHLRMLCICRRCAQASFEPENPRSESEFLCAEQNDCILPGPAQGVYEVCHCTGRLAEGAPTRSPIKMILNFEEFYLSIYFTFSIARLGPSQIVNSTHFRLFKSTTHQEIWYCPADDHCWQICLPEVSKNKNH